MDEHQSRVTTLLDLPPEIFMLFVKVGHLTLDDVYSMILTCTYVRNMRHLLFSCLPQRRIYKGFNCIISCIVYSHDGKYIAMCSGSRIHVYDAKFGYRVCVFKHCLIQDSIAFKLDSRYIVSGMCSFKTPYINSITCWDIESGKRSHELSVAIRGNTGTTITISPDAVYAAFCRCYYSKIRVLIVNTETGNKISEFSISNQNIPVRVAFTCDSKLIAIGTVPVYIYDVATGTRITELSGGVACVSSIAFSPNKQYVACGGNDSHISVWDINSGSLLGVHMDSRHMMNVRVISFSHDSKLILSCSYGGKMVIRNVENGDYLKDLRGDRVTSAVFSLDDKQCVISRYRNEDVKISNL